jgi:hypothetical protein
MNGDRFVIGFFVVVLFALLMMWAFGAKGASAICLRTGDMEATLALHGEAEAAKGPSTQGRLMRLFVTPSGSTWSLIISGGNGRSCLVGAGSDWTRTVSREGSL